MSEFRPREELNRDALNFLVTVSNLVTLDEYAEGLHEELGLQTADAMDRAYRNYDCLETVESLIRLARGICDKHHLGGEIDSSL
jgi:hypothetical protein